TARWLLAQLVYKVLRRDARLREWFKRIKRRRGSTIARVAVMRKLATVIWYMLSKKMTYGECRARLAAERIDVNDRTGGEDLALWCQSRMEEGGIVPPHSGLAPGTALGLLPSRALSSAQANCMVAQGQRTLELHRGKKGGRTNHDSTRLFDPS